MDYLSQIIQGAQTAMSEREFLEKEIAVWKSSEKRKLMIKADEYYGYQHDIRNRKREAIGKGGVKVEVSNLPNNRITDNQYAKAVDQKVNYSFAKAFTIDTKNKAYADLLNALFNNRFRKVLKNLARDAINCGINYLYPFYDEHGNFKIKRFRPWEILPFWKDEDHTELDAFLRIYNIEGYEGTNTVTVEKVEFYTTRGIDRYVLQNGRLILDVENPSGTYMTMMTDGEEIPLAWERVPLIAFKFDDLEMPLLKRVLSLQDAINLMLSDYLNIMQEDARNTILVIENYDGQDLGEFRQNLATFGAVKVRSDGTSKGGVSALTVEVNKDNFESILKVLKDALIENARALDAKSDRLGNAPNQMNIQSMYSDLDLDANGIELEFKAAFEDLLWFYNQHLFNNGHGDFENESVEITFNRDILMNEAEAIQNCSTSLGVISRKTLLANHPYVVDVDNELALIKSEEAELTQQYNAPLKDDGNEKQ